MIRRFIQGVPMYAESTIFYSPRASPQASLLHEEELENTEIQAEHFTPDQVKFMHCTYRVFGK